MAKGRLHVLRSKTVRTGSTAAPPVESESAAIQGSIAESELWSMAAFRLQDAATWMVRLAAASRSRAVRTRLMEIHDSITGDAADLLRQMDVCPHRPAPPDARAAGTRGVPS